MSMKQPCERILITAALPYANGYLHLGHLAGAYLPADMRRQGGQGADSRWHRAMLL